MNDLYASGNTRNPRAIVVCDIPTDRAYANRAPMSGPCMKLFREQAEQCGFTAADFAFLIPSPPLTEDAALTDKRTREYLDRYREEFLQRLQTLIGTGASLLIYMGKFAGYQTMGRDVKITKVRGQIEPENEFGIPLLPLLSPGNVLRRPEMADIYDSDFRIAASFKDAGWTAEQYSARRLTGSWSWCLDLEEAGIDLDNPPAALALDIETVGLKFYDPAFRVLTVQLSWQAGQAIVIPLDMTYFNNPDMRGETTRHLPRLTNRLRDRILNQLRRLLGNPAVGVTGHNAKFDLHGLSTVGVEVANWAHDTVQLAFVVDDNMQIKGLDACARRWLPEMANYAEGFNTSVNKDRMDLVPHDVMLPYAGGDADVARRLARVLVPLAMQDARNYNCYLRVQMPALRQFLRMEKEGIGVNEASLRELMAVVKEQHAELNRSLLEQIPDVVKRRHLEANPKKKPDKVLSFTRAEFIIDALFKPRIQGGRGHRPRVWTDETAMLPDINQRIPSVSAKQHLIYFDEDPFVTDLIDLVRLNKLSTTYLGNPGGFEYTPVKLLKSGKAFASAAQAILDKEGLCEEVTYEEATGEAPDTERYWIPAGPKTLVFDSQSRLWWKTYTAPSGFWKYLSEDCAIHPGFHLERTTTGRSSSTDPNGQNLPKRGRTPRLKILVKSYRKVFRPRDGWVLIEADLSQAELRLVAWEANETTMRRIYREGGDIHATTGAKVMGINAEAFAALDKDTRDFKRFSAKSINFGFVYGMWWKRYMSFARTDYGLVVSPEEAEQIREDYFDLYNRLPGWHDRKKQFVREKGYVRSLHGALRRLPSIYSDDEGVQRESERQAINSTIQRFGSDLGLMGMSIFGRWCPWELMHPIGFIHDAVLIQAQPEYADEAMQSIKWCLQNVPLQEWFGITSPIPLLADVSCGPSLGEVEERADIAEVRPLWLPEDFASR